jgi:hypothetical protein
VGDGNIRRFVDRVGVHEVAAEGNQPEDYRVSNPTLHAAVSQLVDDVRRFS